MKISTRGRYAIRVMLDLAEHNTGEYIPLMDIAKRQEISEKYLEAIVAALSKNGFVRAQRGKGGGYKVTEGSLAPVACLEGEVNTCERVDTCKTLKMWKDFHKLVQDYFDKISLQDLIGNSEDVGNYVI